VLIASPLFVDVVFAERSRFSREGATIAVAFCRIADAPSSAASA
jgi:hypothetical protein